MNELFTEEIIQMNRAHMLYLSFVMFRSTVESTQFKDQNIKPLLVLLAKIFALK